MITTLRDRPRQYRLAVALVAAAVLALAYLLGQRASLQWLGLLAAGAGGLLLLARPSLGLFGLVAAALLLPLEIGTGTEVRLNPVTLLIPAVAGVWLLAGLRRGELALLPSRVHRPLLLFLAAGLLSLLVGRAAWDPTVPVGGSFLLVQLAQWAIFAFSALAFWLTAHLARDEETLWRLTAFFLLVGGGVAILRLVPGLGGQVNRLTTAAFIRAPFWALLAALAGGQLLWNGRLSSAWRLFLATTLLVGVYYGFFINRESSSTWVGIGAALGVLIWLRFPRLRWPLVIIAVALVVVDILFPYVWEFAGGDDAWFSTGGSRLALIERVVEVTLRNPITGLGPAAYRPYANMTPLVYEHIFWVDPRVNSHNNYVDLFAHGGLLGLILFGWFAAEYTRIGIRLHRRYTDGFAAGYVNAMLAAGAVALVLMLFADWILPFVYNIGFPGFQASVLVWLFLGGLVVIEQFTPAQESADG